MMSTAIRLAISPAFRPPMPSQTTNSPRSGAAARLSSLCSRFRPTSVNAACAISIGANLSRDRLEAGAEIFGHVRAALIAPGRILLQRAIDDCLAEPGRIGPDRRERGMRLVRDLKHQGGHAVALKRLLAREQLEQHHAQREQIGAAVHL